jgi:hypothetical protein
MSKCRSEPCSTCPYRQDVPSGVWADTEYEKLRAYDNKTEDQPIGPFMCHATPEHLCHGWAVCHTRRADAMAKGGEHAYDLVALRMFPPDSPLPQGTTPLWESGNEAADHGQAEIEHPSIDARLTVERLKRKYPRIREGADE